MSRMGWREWNCRCGHTVIENRNFSCFCAPIKDNLKLLSIVIYTEGDVREGCRNADTLETSCIYDSVEITTGGERSSCGVGVGLQKVQLQQEAMLCDPALCTHLLPEQKLADGLTWLPFACRCAEPDCNWENVIREEACPWFLVLHVGC